MVFVFQKKTLNAKPKAKGPVKSKFAAFRAKMKQQKPEPEVTNQILVNEPEQKAPETADKVVEEVKDQQANLGAQTPIGLVVQ